MTERHDAEVILVGNELLGGERGDRHLAFLGRALRPAGVRIVRAHTVGDNTGAIASLVRERMGAARVLIVTGGLGPTDDDITRDGVAEAVGAPLEFDEPTWSRIVEFFAARGRTPSDANRRQAMFPRGAEIVGNALGTAPGFHVTHNGADVFVLPGPPGELQAMFNELVLPRVSAVFARPALRMEHYRTIGVGESQLVELLGDSVADLNGFTVSWLPNTFGVDVVLTARPDATVAVMDVEANRLHERMSETLGSKYYVRGERSLAKVVGDALVAHSQTVAVAESLTGGTVARLFTEHSGSSAYFLASTVAYANEAKVDLLGVRAETIEQFGAVSEEVCTEMAHGIRRRAKATWGLATTGIAGPTGATPHKPVGLTFIGVAWDGGVQVKRLIYTGDRHTIRERAAHGVIWLLHDRMAQLSV
ncbi:MAG TPA: CinA family nicotinamide mononucleotide deamidase-related protein [Candidatus Krumholzibacteria bacterium]|nr:CinA family nicotinamide mononucleotide deamidase-related protein [Candidatus Krumholzibacteria bacterium]